MRISKYIAAAALLILPAVAEAQTRAKFEQEVAVGVVSGMNMSQVRFLHNDLTSENQIGDIKWRHGATIGVAGRYIAQKHFGIQLEVNYLQGGWKDKFQETATANGISFAGAETDGKLDYMSIPLLAHIYFGNKARFFVNVGPKIGFLMKCEREYEFTEEQFELINSTNPNDPRINDSIEEKKTDYGICIGGGFEWHAKHIDLFAEARWTYGLQDVYPHDKKDVFQRTNNQNISLCVGVLLPVVKFHSN